MLPKTLISFLWHFVRPYRKSFFGMLIAVFVYAVLTTLNPYLLKIIIDDLASSGNSSSNLLTTIFLPCILFVLVFQAMDFSWAIYDYFKLKTLPKVRADVINELFSHLQKHSFNYFQKNFTGTLANKVADMARSAESIVSQCVEPLFSQCVTLLIATFSIYLVCPLAAIVLFLWSFLFLGIVLFFHKKTLYFSTLFSESNSDCMGRLVDSVTNILSSKLFARQKFEKEYLAKQVEDSKEKDEQLQWHALKIKFFQGLSVTLLFGCILGALIYAREQNKISIGDFAFILSLAMTVMQGLWYLASHFLTFSQELGICNQALSIVSVPHEILDSSSARSLVVSKGEIRFENVSFNYERGNNIFNNKSLIISGGQKVGLVGFSGSGKTTFASLILRFFDVQFGKILIDNQDIKNIKQESLHQQIAMIPQDPMLFHRSLMDNIRYGALNATDEEVILAAKKAHCHEFIELLPEGYQAMVGERGLRLSGGQRQRIAIARAFLKNAPILILDEATSALDSMTERKIQESLSALMKDRTTIVIAHRLSTLSDMDRILVFKKGQVIEDGTHPQLIKNKGEYSHLWEMQVGGFLPESPESTS